MRNGGLIDSQERCCGTWWDPRTTIAFSQSCWVSLGITWDLSFPPLDMIIRARSDFEGSIFREVVLVASWCIWCHCNDIIFDHGSLSLARCKTCFVGEMAPVLLRDKPRVKLMLDNFMSSLSF
ncbi:hypothetical protein SETIT_J026600v2 [Setaria italica]|uniref:Uncharacterized protein n=1 Tax=Setaria italica TaxID=4555 RepID=A0A368PFB2_SETIT|nr:hypothetical protein SETIT_J026600v2 [Setaria italica]